MVLEYADKKKTLLSLFMDGVQISHATKKRQFTFYLYVPRSS